MTKSRSIASRLVNREWRRDNHLVSTNASLIPIPQLIEMFGQKEFYWANPLPEDAMREMLQNSLCFGLFRDNNTTNSNNNSATQDTAAGAEAMQFLGLARCVTDFTTFLYVTDVWINPQEQGKGLGTWLIKCVQEVIEEMPHLRRSMLFTTSWDRSVPFYERFMGMDVIECQRGVSGLAVMERKGKGHPAYGRQGSSYD